MFNIFTATTQQSINQLFEAYYNGWNGDYNITNLYNLYYYTSTSNDNIVKCRAYYQFDGIYNGYWCNYMNYDITTGLYIYVGGGNSATSTSNGLTSSDLNNLTLYYPIPINTICFPAGTPITCNQGQIPIEKINPEMHTIKNKPIVGITKTIDFFNKYLVQFEKDSLGNNIPSQKTIVSKNHKVFYKGQMIKAYQLVTLNDKIKKIKYNGEVLYNVLMEEYDKMIVNNLICETLNPQNDVAKIYKACQNLNIEEQQQMIKWYNEEYKKKNNIVRRRRSIMNFTI